MKHPRLRSRLHLWPWGGAAATAAATAGGGRGLVCAGQQGAEGPSHVPLNLPEPLRRELPPAVSRSLVGHCDLLSLHRGQESCAEEDGKVLDKAARKDGDGQGWPETFERLARYLCHPYL
jgi:hypothetical protein